MKSPWRLWFQKLGGEYKILLSAAALALVPIIGSTLVAPEPQPPRSSRSADVDTLIPRGFVLVPIEIQNFEALDALIGRFGIVDLLQATSPEGPRGQLVARNVRLLRAPQNPTQFAVLVPESEVAQILKNGGVFTVIVKRPEQSAGEVVKEAKLKRRKIVYE